MKNEPGSFKVAQLGVLGGSIPGVDGVMPSELDLSYSVLSLCIKEPVHNIVTRLSECRSQLGRYGDGV